MNNFVDGQPINQNQNKKNIPLNPVINTKK